MKTLIISGTGIKFLSHLTVEVKSIIETTDCVVFLLNEPAIKKWVSKTAKKCISLDSIYFASIARNDAYIQIAEAIISYFEKYQSICFLTYGHPTIFSSITKEITTRVRALEINYYIMPGISALDCLLADLNIDPGVCGLQTYDSTEFMIHDQFFSENSHLVLWQIAIIGMLNIVKGNKINLNFQKKMINILLKKLIKQYPEDHEIILYVASQYPGVHFDRQHLKLKELNSVQIPRLATLYIPPIINKQINIETWKHLNHIYDNQFEDI